jgi:hypothetical protein
MRSLAELQDAMAAAIFKGHAADIEAELVAGGAEPARRFNIYRNNTFLSLTAHLKTLYPVTARLGDERFFAYAAHAFILRKPPREPRLAVYGAEFPRFLALFPASRTTPILSRMAALEWVVHQALIAGEQPPLTIAAIAGGSACRLRLVLQPSLGFTISEWPLLPLWSGSQATDQPIARCTERLAVLRSRDSVRVFTLSPARFAFWRALSRGLALDRAAERAFCRDPQFDLTTELAMLFRAELVTGLIDLDKLH